MTKNPLFLPRLRFCVGVCALVGFLPKIWAVNYTWNADSGSWGDRYNWVETENQSPMAPKEGPSVLDRITTIDGSINLSLRGVSRTVAEVYRLKSRGKWYIYGDGTDPVTFTVDKIQNLCAGDLIFQNGSGGKGPFTVHVGEINVAFGSVYFGAKSKTQARALTELQVRERTKISGFGNLYLNLEEGANRSSLGVLSIEEGGATLNVSPDAGSKRVSIRGLKGGPGYIQAGLDSDSGGEVVLEILAEGIHRASVELRDSLVAARGSVRLSVLKQGSGTQILTAKNTYGGTTVIEEGRLVVDGSHVGGGAYAIKAGGALAGVGVIEAKRVLVENGGTLSPGNVEKAAATLLFSVEDVLDLSLLEGRGGLEFDLQADGSVDCVKLLSGRLNIGALSFSDFRFACTGRPRAGKYIIIDAVGPISGAVSEGEGEINGATVRIVIDAVNHDVVLIIR